MAQTLLDLAALSGKREDLQLAKAAIKAKPFLAMMPFEPTNGMSFQSASGTVPSISTSGVNQGYSATSGNIVPKDFKVAQYSSRSQVDVRIADTYSLGVNKYRESEDMLVYEGLLDGFSSDIFYANQNTDANDFYGLSRYMNTLDGDTVVNGTGASADVQTSIYFVKWGAKGVSGIYNAQASPLPIAEDMGKQYVDAPDGNGEMLAYVTNFDWKAGIKVNEAGIGRLANIENSGDVTLANLQRIRRFVKNGVDAIFCNRAGASYLDVLSNNNLTPMVLDSELKVAVDTFQGIPIFVEDAIVHTEAVIS